MTNWIEKSNGLDISIRNFIDGQYVACRGTETFSKYSPRDGSLLYEVPHGEAEDANEAISNAKAVFESGVWSRRSAGERKKVLLKLADLMEEHAEELSLLECLDVGKTIQQSLAVVPKAAGVIRYNAEAADKLFGKMHMTSEANLSYELRHPIGVAAGIIAWNAPVNLAAMKIGPALAVGNSLVLKPAELASLSTARLAELAIEAGLPKGVLNVVHGLGTTVGATIAHHLDVDLLSFTGSTQTGKQLLIASGQSNMKKLMLECGGKSPSIIFEDCPDLDTAADAVTAFAFNNQGQVCSAGTRLLVQRNIQEVFLEKVLERVAKLKPDDPLKPETNFGALISLDHMNKVLGYIDSAKQDGTQLLCGGERLATDNGGYYVPPTIFDNVKPDQKIAQEEIFGPVLSVMSFDDETDAVSIANDSDFGLAAYVWTSDSGRAHRMIDNIKAGGIMVQTANNGWSGGPAFGAMSIEPHKLSGLGSELGIDGLKAYTINRRGMIYL